MQARFMGGQGVPTTVKADICREGIDNRDILQPSYGQRQWCWIEYVRVQGKERRTPLIVELNSGRI